ncbi:MAG TPA: ribosome biogenesis GTPase Der [Alphaproteobacteria bacterium]|nr:ribosome biogenesis GTPase Der [Alphaproteobacteria bacterium]
MRIAIVGRPNVGKSTLFNRLAGKKLALVHDTPGVTRDWREAPAKLVDLSFIAIDTAGVESAKSGSLGARLSDVTRRALGDADVALLVVDAREGLKPADKEVAALLRKTGLPTILVANKCDHALPAGYDEFHSLGFGEPLAVSAEHGVGMRDLYEQLRELESADVQEEEKKDASEPPLHLAIIGRPNVGKSTLVNMLLGQERMLTGPEAGLTRDAVHIAWEWQDKKIRLVDTAGQRRTSKVHEKLETMAVDESRRAVRLAHVVVLVVDATEMFEKQDLDLARLVVEEGRALVLAVNKWDLVTNKQEVTKALRTFLDKNLAQVPDIPFVHLSALKDRKADKLMAEVFAIYELWNRRISTGQLNRWLEPLLEHHPPPIVQSKRVKIRYMTQIKSRPPTFLLWVSKPLKLPDSYMRYLMNDLRRFFNMPGVPMRFEMRKGENPYERRKNK